MSRFGKDGVSTSQKGDKYYLAVSSKGQIYGGAQINGAENITWLQSITNEVFKFAGNAKIVQIRSGSNGIKNLYIDVYDASGNKNSIGFLTDGENAIKFYTNDTVVWSLKVN